MPIAHKPTNIAAKQLPARRTMPRPVRVALLIFAPVGALLWAMEPRSEQEWTNFLCTLSVLVFAVLPFVMLALTGRWLWAVAITAALLLCVAHMVLQHYGFLEDDYFDDNPMLALPVCKCGFFFGSLMRLLRAAGEWIAGK